MEDFSSTSSSAGRRRAGQDRTRKFTLVSATTGGAGDQSLRDRFGIPVRLNFYTEEELERSSPAAPACQYRHDAGWLQRIAPPAARRGSPAAAAAGADTLRRPQMPARSTRHRRPRADALEVDAAGLDAMDRRYLTTIAMNCGGGPVGVETMAAALSEPRDAVIEDHRAVLIQCGYLQRTRGRLLTRTSAIGLAGPRATGAVRIVRQRGGRRCRHHRDHRGMIRDSAGRVLLVRRGTTAFAPGETRRREGASPRVARSTGTAAVDPRSDQPLGEFDAISANEPGWGPRPMGPTSPATSCRARSTR